MECSTMDLKRIRAKAHDLKTAFDTHQDAYLKYNQAVQRWKETPSQETALGLVTTDSARDNARDEIISHAQSLLDLTQQFLITADPHDFKSVRKQVIYLQEG